MGAGGMGAWLGIAATFMVATKLDLYRHLAERLSFKPAQRKNFAHLSSLERRLANMF